MTIKTRAGYARKGNLIVLVKTVQNKKKINKKSTATETDASSLHKHMPSLLHSANFSKFNIDSCYRLLMCYQANTLLLVAEGKKKANYIRLGPIAHRCQCSDVVFNSPGTLRCPGD